MSERTIPTITGGLSGFVVGWIWGNAITGEPDVVVFAVFLCTIVGLVAGFNPEMRDQVGNILGAVIGLYLGWVLKVLLFGDSPGGWGVLLVFAGMSGGAELGAKAVDRRPRQAEAVLINVLYAGFLGGMFVDVVLLDAIFGWRTDHSVLTQAPVLLISGALGGLAAALSFGREEARSNTSLR
jgi:hypothetical protein